MKIPSITAIALSAVIVCAPVHATEPGLDDNTATTKAEESEIRVNLMHVKPDWMAQWLQSEIPSDTLNFIQEDFGKTELPAGWTLVPNNSNDILTLRFSGDGKHERIEDVRALITALDKPIPHFSITLKFVKVPVAEIESKGFKGGIMGMLTLRSRGVDEIQKLIAAQKATVWNTSSVTAVNKVKAVTVLNSGDFYFKKNNQDGSLQGYTATKWEQRWEATPHIRNDGSISLKVNYFDGYTPVLNAESKSDTLTNLPQGAKIVENVKTQTIATNATIKSGDSLFLGALHTDNDEHQLFVLITAQQIHLNEFNGTSETVKE